MKWIELCEVRTKVKSTNHSGLTLAREMRHAIRFDLLMVVFAMVVVAHWSIIRGERRGGDEWAAGGYVLAKSEEGQVGAGGCGYLFR